MWAITPENEDARIWLASEPTATAGGMPMKIKQRRHQEAAADPEHAGQETDRPAEPEQQEQIDRHLGDGKVDVHGPLGRRARARAPLPRVLV